MGLAHSLNRNIRRRYMGRSKIILMKITKKQLRRIIKEKKTRLINEQEGGLSNYRVTMVVALPPGQEDYILESIELGMEFDELAGEGILEYDVREEAPQ